ncbi:hypothetical protein NQ318_007597 [Aromia moschata]|uniref:Equilibrative nucleoside transporter 3 n=1 Tax=Aromia moschata TaxID=1265417 RepID=A0AAV8YAI3_9CUCU|nr:hypothetical protein NQ318_007597 [Aromia moschata]
MYKFRDTSSEEIDLNNKTALQTYFAPGIMISQSMPVIISTLFTTVLGHKLPVRTRIIASLMIIILIFVIFTVMIKVNTDSWQVGFFVFSMIGLAALNTSLPVFQVTTLPLVAKFPMQYMHVFLMGQGSAGIFNSLLQIISLAIGSSIEISALFYFVVGTMLICITMTLYIISKNMAFYQFYMENSLSEPKTGMFSKAEVKDIIKDTWPCLAVGMVTIINLLFLQPSVTSLVVSEGYGKGNEWNDTYFVPVITYFFNEATGLVGRLTARKGLITHSSRYWWLIIVIGRFFVMVPLIMLCNAQPRNHLPVWFPHDWQYILILAILSFTNGFIFNTMFFSVSQLAPGKEEASLMVMMCWFGILMAVSSPLSLISVHIL